MLTLASNLSDQDLLERVVALAIKERETSVELVAHLAALETRPSLYAAEGCGSLFAYCTQVLRLSEDAACNRISAARACRRFPEILDLLISGTMSLTSVRMLFPHLTPENHTAVLARAGGRSRREIEALVAELAPRPDVAASVRKVPTVAPAAPPRVPAPMVLTVVDPTPAVPTELAEPARPLSTVPLLPTPRPIIETTSPDRYRVQFTIGKESHDTLRRLQDLLRREIPNGDSGRHRRARSYSASREGREGEDRGRRRDRSALVLSVPERIRRDIPEVTRLGRSHSLPVPSQAMFSARRRPATVVSAGSLARPDGDAPSARSSSSITSCRTLWAVGPRWRTSRCAAGATTNTKPIWPSAVAALPRTVSTVPGNERSARRPLPFRLDRSERGAKVAEGEESEGTAEPRRWAIPPRAGIGAGAPRGRCPPPTPADPAAGSARRPP